MRKLVNTCFVVMAVASVTYGMILKYSPGQHRLISTDDSPLIKEVSLTAPELTEVKEDQFKNELLLTEPD